MQGKSVFPLILPNCLHVLQPIHISERRSHPLSSLRRGFNLHLGLRATLLIHSLYNFESKQENGIGVVQSCKVSLNGFVGLDLAWSESEVSPSLDLELELDFRVPIHGENHTSEIYYWLCIVENSFNTTPVKESNDSMLNLGIILCVI